MPGKILLTGAEGFTGKYFSSVAAKAGYECISLNSLAEDGQRVDLRNKNQLQEVLSGKQFDYLVHLAAISFVNHGDISDIYNVNAIGTFNLLDALKEAGIVLKKQLICSSANVYGVAENAFFNENSVLNPQNDYAVSKVAMEYGLNFRTQTPTVVVRPFNYTGVGQAAHFLVPKMVSAYKSKANVLQLGNLEVARDFSDVRDVVNYYMQLLLSDAAVGVFNICSGKSTSLMLIKQTLQELTGFSPEIQVNPQFVRANEIKMLRGDHSRLRAFTKSSDTREIRDTLEWMLQN